MEQLGSDSHSSNCQHRSWRLPVGEMNSLNHKPFGDCNIRPSRNLLSRNHVGTGAPLKSHRFCEFNGIRAARNSGESWTLTGRANSAMLGIQVKYRLGVNASRTRRGG